MPTFKDNALCPIIIIYKTSCICNYENGFNSPSGDDNLFGFKDIYNQKTGYCLLLFFEKKKTMASYTLFNYQIFTHYSFINVFDIFSHTFKVRHGIVTLTDKDVIFRAIFLRF